MNPDTRFAASAGLALALNATWFAGVVRGTHDVLHTGGRFVVSFLVMFVAVGILGRLYNGYLETHLAADRVKAEIERAEAEALASPLDPDTGVDVPRRRASDVEEP